MMPEACKIDMGHILRRYKESAGLTNNRLARLCDVSPSKIFYWHNGDHAPTADHLRSYLAACGVTHATLIDDMAAIGWVLEQPTPTHRPEWTRKRSVIR